MAETQLEVQYVDPDSLMPVDWNPRKITPSALRALAKLMDVHGFVDPVIARSDDRMILGGHQRIAANRMRKSPDDMVPVIFLDGVSDNRARALNIALNNPSAQGSFDYHALSTLVDQIDTACIDLSDSTGLAEKELEDLAASLTPPAVETIDQQDLMKVETDTDDEVVLIFEMTDMTYKIVRNEFDRLIADYDLNCHIRVETQPSELKPNHPKYKR